MGDIRTRLSILVYYYFGLTSFVFTYLQVCVDELQQDYSDGSKILQAKFDCVAIRYGLLKHKDTILLWHRLRFSCRSPPREFGREFIIYPVNQDCESYVIQI